LKNKQDELQQLVSIQIPENKKEIRRAREFGDLSENFEYKAARQKQAQLYGKVRNIISNEAPVAQALLKHARGEKITINKVQYEIIKIEKAI
jgi:transcription elongation GreA/GreB family factor